MRSFSLFVFSLLCHFLAGRNLRLNLIWFLFGCILLPLWGHLLSCFIPCLSSPRWCGHLIYLTWLISFRDEFTKSMGGILLLFHSTEVQIAVSEVYTLKHTRYVTHKGFMCKSAHSSDHLAFQLQMFFSNTITDRPASTSSGFVF